MPGTDKRSQQDQLELNPPEREKAALQYASWGPQGNQLAYVFNGDIYYMQSVTSKALRLTSTDQEPRVVNGLSDWTYEEEVLLTYVAHWWSMDGARLAYLTINNSATPVMEIPHFLGGIYPTNMVFSYPKAGSNIPSVTLFVVNLYGPAHTLEMLPPDSFRARDSYISMVTWISSTRLAVRWLNRVQNQSVLCVCEATTGACSEKHKMAMDIMQNRRQPYFLFHKLHPSFQTGRTVIYVRRLDVLHHPGSKARRPWRVPPHRRPLSSARRPHRPPSILDIGQLGRVFAVRPRRGGRENWPLLAVGWSRFLDSYFLSTEESKQSRHLYSVDLDGVFQRQCISCNLIEGCRFFKAEFSPNQTHFTLYCLGPGIPKVTVHYTKNPSNYVVLEDNNPLSKAMEDKRLPENLFRTLPADNHDLHLKLSLPPGYEANLHPLLIIVDGVPGSQSVTEEFALEWPQVLSGLQNVALAWVDGRSGVGRGQKTTVDPRRLASMRVKDYLGVVELLMQLPYIDDHRIVLYGKGFGGYLTLKMSAATEKLFQCAVAVAPITDFRLYSAAFSERYLGLPAKEEHAYSTASVLEEVTKLKDENLLIVHGTADAKVHFQHSAELLSRLVKVEANYSLQLYPDEGHILRGPRSVQHFQRTVVNYLQNCLRHSVFQEPVEDDEEEDE
ncbi:inactive dipeptidyl peptidase 10 isoform X2 [Takifugu rubripes]|uniref:inactive dipeptidyl peptidase 10 isoform X2 n=1 Tax=Takifugu rubripes TaxID=31033 RepID=UPI0011454EE4|nr:inactive dipeptidyl peptidase 10-like isoform X2 [Takifugu rubripes]